MRVAFSKFSLTTHTLLGAQKGSMYFSLLERDHTQISCPTSSTSNDQLIFTFDCQCIFYFTVKNHLFSFVMFKVEFSPPPSSSLLGCSQTRPLLPRMMEAPIGNWWKWVLRLFTRLGDTLGLNESLIPAQGSRKEGYLTRQPWPSLPYLRLLVCMLKDPSWKMLWTSAEIRSPSWKRYVCHRMRNHLVKQTCRYFLMLNSSSAPRLRSSPPGRFTGNYE